MEKVFVNTENALNPKGVYSIKLNQLGVPKTITIDDKLPLRNGSTIFSEPGTDNSLWMAVLEKAFAKYHGNYAHIEAGDPSVAITTMTGAPYIQYAHNANTDVNELWGKLVAHDQAKDIMTCGSSSGSDKNTSSTGIVLGHAYTLLSTVVTSGGVKLVKVRNPHGNEKYTGPYSDGSTQMTEAL